MTSKRFSTLLHLSLAICFFSGSPLFGQSSRDLIQEVELSSPGVEGSWKTVDSTLKVSASKAKLQLTQKVPQSYQIVMEFTRTAGKGSIGVILPVGSSQCLCNLSAFDGEAHGIGLIDGKLAKDNATTIRPGTLENNHPYRFIIEVDVKNDQATIGTQLDGKQSLNWSGSVRSLSMFPAWNLPSKSGLGLFTTSEFTFHRIQLRPLRDSMKMASPPAKLPSASSTNSKVLFDLAHGEGPAAPLSRLVTEVGAQTTENRQPITKRLLSSYKLVILRVPKAAFSSTEVTALIEFIQNGGSVLLVMDEERRTPLGTTRCNDILSPFKMKLTDDTPYLHNCGATTVAGNVVDQSFEIPFSGGRAVEGGTPFAFQLTSSGDRGEVMASFYEHDSGGRLIVMADGMAAMLMGTPNGVRLTGVPRDPAQTTYWGSQSRPFMKQVIQWLLSSQ